LQTITSISAGGGSGYGSHVALYRSDLGWGGQIVDDIEIRDGPTEGNGMFALGAGGARYFNGENNTPRSQLYPFTQFLHNGTTEQQFYIPLPVPSPTDPRLEWTMSSSSLVFFDGFFQRRTYSDPFNYTTIETDGRGGLQQKIGAFGGSFWVDAHNRLAQSNCVAPSQPPATCYYPSPTNPMVTERFGRVPASQIGLNLSSVESLEGDYAAIYRWTSGGSNLDQFLSIAGTASMPGAQRTPVETIRAGLNARYNGAAFVQAVSSFSALPVNYTTSASVELNIASASGPSLDNTNGISSINATIDGLSFNGVSYPSLFFSSQVTAGNSLFSGSTQGYAIWVVSSASSAIEYGQPGLQAVGSRRPVRYGELALNFFGPSAQEVAGTFVADIPNTATSFALGLTGAFIARRQ
jgi:hypothetical protein